MDRAPFGIKAIQLQPAEIKRIAGGPDDRGDACGGKVQRCNRMRHANGVWGNQPCLRLWRQVEAVAGDIGVGFGQHRTVVSIAFGQIGRKIAAKAYLAICIALHATCQRHSCGGELPEVDGFATLRAADRDGDVFGARGCLSVPFVQNPQPPDEIAAPVAAGGTTMRAHRQRHAAASLHQLICNLRARRTGPHHQHATFGQLIGVAVGCRMDLGDPRIIGHQRGHHRALEGAGGGDHIAGLDHPGRGLHLKARTFGVAADVHHLDAAADRGGDLGGVIDEIVRNRVFARKCVWVACEFQPRKAVVPGRAIGHQIVPPPRAPFLGDARPLQHQMWDSVFGQMFTHGDSSLPCADHKDFDCLNGHAGIIRARYWANSKLGRSRCDSGPGADSPAQIPA